MSNETNKPIEAQELTEKELEGVVGGLKVRGEVILDPMEIEAGGAQFVPVPPPMTGGAVLAVPADISCAVCH